MIDFTENNTDGVAILCGVDSAYVHEKYKMYEGYLRYFYSKITFIKNFNRFTADANKFTVYFPNKNSKEFYENIFKPKYENDFSVTVGDTIWIDIGLVRQPYGLSHKSCKMHGILLFLSGSCSETEVSKQLYYEFWDK
jgi:hypothetical protein